MTISQNGKSGYVDIYSNAITSSAQNALGLYISTPYNYDGNSVFDPANYTVSYNVIAAGLSMQLSPANDTVVLTGNSAAGSRCINWRLRYKPVEKDIQRVR